jgi:MoaA/NifB/PqqE/SkfB family radical SAM enzyme
MLKWSEIKKVIDEIARIGKSITITGGGEPSLNRNLLRAVKYAKDKDLSVGLITNGSNICCNDLLEMEQYVSFVRFSIDSAVKETYCRLRGTTESTYLKLMNTISSYMSLSKREKTKSIVGVQIVWVDQSRADIEESVRFFVDLEVDFVQIRPVDNVAYERHTLSNITYSLETGFLINLIQNYSNSHTQIIPNVNKFEDYINNQTRKSYIGCQGANFTASIGHDNKVYFCCSHIGDIAYEIGDLSHSTLVEILQSDKRANLIRDVNHADCQFQCRNHHLNKVLEKFDLLSGGQQLQFLDNFTSDNYPFHYEFL